VSTIVEFEGKAPRISSSAWVAPTAVLIGDVTIEADASIWFGAVLRGDFGRIHVGRGACVQDNCVVHCAEDHPTVIGEGVTVGHLSILEGCTIEKDALVGMGSILMQRVHVGERSLVAAGSVVTEGTDIPAGVVAAGAPASVRKELAGRAAEWIETAARDYQQMRARYIQDSRELLP
jgi:carbonic anhydrase/acetyltransferase-like protein (isoleucine patch superfamily)